MAEMNSSTYPWISDTIIRTHIPTMHFCLFRRVIPVINKYICPVMKPYHIFAAFLMFLFMGMFAQDHREEDVLIAIGDHEITWEEFEWSLEKNTGGSMHEPQLVEDYLRQFIDLKLKVIEAEELGYDTTEAFRKEYAEYSERLAEPYQTVKKDMDYLLREAYERAQTDIHVSHILVACPQQALPEDTAAAYARSMEIRERILSGERFDEVASSASDDPYAELKGGDLGYITVFRTPYSFENAAYNMKPGELSLPVRTMIGYHIIRVNDRRPARGKIRVAQIMIHAPDTLPVEELREAEWRITTIRDSLVSGYDFSELARRNSQDSMSALAGGLLPPIGIGRLTSELEEAAFSLEHPGDISLPVRSPYGWHLIKLMEKIGIGTFDEVREDFKTRIKKSNRERHARLAMLANMKKEYGFKEFNGNLSVYFDIIDDDIFEGDWSVPEDVELTDILFVIGDSLIYSQMDFAKYLEKTQGGYRLTKVTYLNRKMTDYIEKCLFDYEKAQLPFIYPEYRYLLREFRDGILLYSITDDRILSKIRPDGDGIREFYEKNKRAYRWGKRIDATLVTCRDRKVAENAERIMKKRKNRDITISALISRLCTPDYDPECITFRNGIFEKGDNEIVDKVNWRHRVSDIIEHNEKFTFIIRKDLIPRSTKTFEEAFEELTPDYQEYLEGRWITALHEKYPVSVNRGLLPFAD